MKLTKIMPAMALLIPALGLTNVDFHAVECESKHPNIFKAITEFCSKTDIVVPSTYAANGKWVAGKQVKITGLCGAMSPVWVPQYWCQTQFWSVCANANAAGKGMGIFDKCQLFWTTPGATD